MKSTEVLYSRNRQVQRHRWCVEKQRIFASFINVFVYFITKQCFQDFLKCFLPKLSAIRTLRLCRSLCLRHLRDIVFMLSPLCSPPLCVPFICSIGLLYHSKFLQNLLCFHLRVLPPLCVPFICSRLTLSLQIPEESGNNLCHIIKYTRRLIKILRNECNSWVPHRLSRQVRKNKTTYAHHVPFVLLASYHLAYADFLFF